MNILSWNCRGDGGKGFVGLVNDLVKEYNVGILCLMGTHIIGVQASRIRMRLVLDKS